jgi:hypothetical protein
MIFLAEDVRKWVDVRKGGLKSGFFEKSMVLKFARMGAVANTET